MSFILRPPTSSRLQLLPLVASFAVVDCIKRRTGLVASVRWPNDVIIRRRKVAGVIAESSYSSRRFSHAIIGVGLNCNCRADSLAGVEGTATTLKGELGRPVEIDSIRDGILSAFDDLYSSWKRGEDVVGARKPDISTIGRRVLINLKGGERPISGAVGDVTSEGVLVTAVGGEERRIRAEDLDSLVELAE